MVITKNNVVWRCLEMEDKPKESGIERHYSPAEIAEAMGLSRQTITKMIEGEEGIVRIGHRGLKRTKVTLRVPESTWKRIHEKWTVK